MLKSGVAGLLVAAGLLATPALAQSATAYGEDWYRGEFWSGEYPDGFTALKDVTVQLRPRLDPTAEKTIACPLPAKATYQPWNNQRVIDDGLTFVSFTEIDEMKLTKAYETTLYQNLDATAVPIKFAAGATWKYLAYFGEGAFLMEYEGVQYDGDQDLVEASVSTVPGGRKYDEWLRINCSTNQWGWLFMGDIVQDEVTFTGPNITTYGESKDLD